jgi:organic radical activating enzyme
MYCIPNKVDFYITNVCNLTCDRCNRFNNHDFRGWQRWSEYESVYEQWGKLVDLSAVTIMGGEPFLNPTLVEWVQGINRIFGIEVQILTNGTRFQYAPDLYNAMLHWSNKNQCRNHIGVSLHDRNQYDQLHSNILDFLQGAVSVYPKGHVFNSWNSDWMYTDSNGVTVNVYVVDQFGSSAIVPRNQKFYLHDSDPVIAHQSCVFAKFKSYHFIRGKLYKCGPVALMPEFDQQHAFDISEQDRILLNSYQALGVDNFDTHHEEFFKSLDQHIPQCKFCPEIHEIQTIFPVRKGSK